MKKEEIKKLLINTGKYTVTILIVVASFFSGRLFENWNNSDKKEEVIVLKKISKKEVNLAIDENNNLIMIDNYTGKYTVYDDSIGNSIFKIYAKSIWAQNSEK
jgi:hypothetical protein